MGPRHRLAIVLPGLLLLALAAASAKDGESEVTKLDRWTYKALYNRVQVVVSVRLLSVKRRETNYLPLWISVSNYSKSTAKVALANVSLKDAEGNDYPVAGLKEVQAEHRLLQYDRERVRALELEGIDPSNARLVDSRFYAEGEAADPDIELYDGERIVDFLYFRDDQKRDPKKLILRIEGLVDAPALVIPMEIPGA